MRSEEQCKAHEKYLLADMLLSDEVLNAWQKDTQKRYKHNTQTFAAYQKYMHWKRGINEAAIFTLYAYADFSVPKTFDCIFYIDHPEVHVRTPYVLSQCIWEGWLPVDFVDDGHKHLCIFTFEEGIPDIIRQLPPEIRDYHLRKNTIRLGLCQFADLQAIIDRKTKEAILKAKYGKEWYDYDDDHP